MTTLSYLPMFGPFQRMISLLLLSFKSVLFVEVLDQWFSTWGLQIPRNLPGIHRKISRGTWMTVEFSCIAIF